MQSITKATILVLIGILQVNLSFGENLSYWKQSNKTQEQVQEQQVSLDKLFKIIIESDVIAIRSLIPFNNIKEDIYLNVINEKAEIIIHQKIEEGEVLLNLTILDIGTYNIEISRDMDKMVKRIAIK